MPILLAGNLQLAFLRAAEEGKIHERQTRGSILGLFAYKADMRLTELPRLVFRFQKCGGGEGAIDGTHKSSDIFLKNDQNNRHDFHFGKRILEIYF